MVRKSALGHCSKLTCLHTEHQSIKETEGENHGSQGPQVEEHNASATQLPEIQPELSKASGSSMQTHRNILGSESRWALPWANKTQTTGNTIWEIACFLVERLEVGRGNIRIERNLWIKDNLSQEKERSNMKWSVWGSTGSIHCKETYKATCISHLALWQNTEGQTLKGTDSSGCGDRASWRRHGRSKAAHPTAARKHGKTREGQRICQRNNLQSHNFWDLTVATRAGLLIAQAAMSPEMEGRVFTVQSLTALWAETKTSACDAFGGALHIQQAIN